MKLSQEIAALALPPGDRAILSWGAVFGYLRFGSRR